MVELVGQLVNEVPHLELVKYREELLVVEFVGRVEVEAEARLEKHGVLRDHGDAPAQRRDAERPRVHTAEADGAGGGLEDAEQRCLQGGLPGPGPANNARALP